MVDVSPRGNRIRLIRALKKVLYTKLICGISPVMAQAVKALLARDRF